MRKDQKRKVILASASPWRKILLERIGIQFEVDVSGYPEDLTQQLSPTELVTKLALGKAQTVAAKYENALILGADSVVVFNQRILGKPLTEEAARTLLKELSGNKHSLVTGFAIVDTASGKTVVNSEETFVQFRALTDDEIRAYVETGEPLTVAGGYAIQGGGASFAKKIEGDFYTIVGLPLASVIEELRRFGL